MNTSETLQLARKLASGHGAQGEKMLASANFLDFAEYIKDIVRDLSEDQINQIEQRHSLSFKEFSESFRKLRDTFEDEVKADPLVIYRPQHKVALEFHKSLAQIRYFFGGNRISKTQTGIADNYWVLTGQHPFRPKPPLPAAVFVIGTNYSQYAPNVFEKKYITGEPGNVLSPVFPNGGRWFNRYDEKKHILYLCCRNCYETRKPKLCTHVKSTLTLFSDVESPNALAGGQYSQGQFDEQVKRDFFPEAKQRIKTVPHAGIIITETPIYGTAWWTYKDIYTLGEKVGGDNWDPETESPIVSNHTTTQFEAGLYDHSKIYADMKTMTEHEIKCRIYGQHVTDSERCVFDLAVIDEMGKESETSTRGVLMMDGENLEERKTTFEELLRRHQHTPENPIPLTFKEQASGFLNVWRKPRGGQQYIIGCDVAVGLTRGDYSCASVLKIKPEGFNLNFELVAQFHGWINSLSYAEELYKLASWYNHATLVVESNGPGGGTLQRLREFGAWFVFRDIASPDQAQFALDSRLGIDTNVRTKSLMISSLQNVIRRRKAGAASIVVYDKQTIEELAAYIQQPTQTGMSFRFEAAGEAHDDRVMSLALATYVATSFPIFNENKFREAETNDMNGDKDIDHKYFWDTLRQELKERDNVL